MKRHVNGFTLIEIAIVLVIVGLLLLSVFKGQDLIASAKVKSLINDFRSTATLVHSYQDRFRRLPGDDGDAVAHIAGIAATTPGAVNNGRINGAWNSATVTDESYLFWQHVRLANLTTGSTTQGAADYPYFNAENGRVGITSDAVYSGAGGWGGNFFVCSSGIQGRHARQIDTTLDDGDTTRGLVRVLGTAATGGELATSDTFASLLPANDGQVYTVCMQN